VRLIKKVWQSRRDFTGLYECEGCGYIQEYKYCYDDRNFHDNVMPRRKCPKCGKSTLDLGIDIEHVPTKYPPDMIV